MRHPLESSACNQEKRPPALRLQAGPPHPPLPAPVHIAGVGVPVPLPLSEKVVCASATAHDGITVPPKQSHGRNVRAPRAVRGGERSDIGAPRSAHGEGSRGNDINSQSIEAIVAAVIAKLGHGSDPTSDRRRRRRFYLCRHWECGEVCPHENSCRFQHGDTAAEASRVKACRIARPFPVRAVVE